MDIKLFDYIQNLSLKDKKTLSQKALKVSEETGELARVVLPFDNAHGTTHRFIEKGKILEESVDVILTAISIAYELGYSHEDIEDAMRVKAEKWQSIQIKEDKVEYPIPYEIHITVDLEKYIEKLKVLESEYESGKNIKIGHNVFSGPYISKLTEEDFREQAIFDFKNICKKIGVKPIVLDLENNGISVMKDVMTSSHIIGDNTSAYEACISISLDLKAVGFEVVRKKIETVPWHPGAPCNEGDKMVEDCYFEAHISCIIHPDQKSILQNIATNNQAHLSKNFFKKLEDGRFINMITFRDKKNIRKDFESTIQSIKLDLEIENIEFEKVISEFCIYDTKISHDYKWISNGG